MTVISRESLLRLVVGRKWQNFIGLSYADTQSALRDALDDLGWTYTDSESSSSLGERIMLGGSETTTFELEDHEFTIECISATFEPVQRAIFSLAIRDETKSKYEDATTVIRISPVTSETEPAIATVVATLMDSIEKDPWEIVHPRFNLSPVLRYKTRIFWEYWQSTPSRMS